MGCTSSSPVSPDDPKISPSPESPPSRAHAKESPRDERDERRHEIAKEKAAAKADAGYRRASLVAQDRKQQHFNSRALKAAQLARELEDRRVKAAAVAAAAAAKKQPPPRLPLPHPGARTHPLALSGVWTKESATGYHTVNDCPQYLLIPATSGQFTLTLNQGYKSPPAALALLKTQPRHAREAGQPKGDFSEFTNVQSPLEVTLEGGVSYTLLVCTFEGGLPDPEQTELDWSVTCPELTLIHPLAPLTTPLTSLLAQDTEESQRVEWGRRTAALARIKSKAMASPHGSTQREAWEDFCAAQAEVERRREAVRLQQRLRQGGEEGGEEALTTPHTFQDGWSGTPQAIGAGWEEGRKAQWVNWRGIAPNPVLVDGGFTLEDVVQGRLGDCYFLACLAELVSGGGGGAAVEEVLDSVFVTGEGNPEGVYCVRLWVGGGWRWLFMDATLPCSHNTYINVGEPGVPYLTTHECGPSPSHGRYHAPLGVTSTNPDEMWACMLEKAWAMLHTSYAACEGHVSVDTFPLNFFMPHSLPGFQIHTPPSDTPPSSPLVASLWRKLCTWKAREWPLTVGSRTKTRKTMGIVKGHAFTVMSVATVEPGSPANHSHVPLHLIELRNPHGNGEWEGQFSDQDLASWTPDLQAELGYNPRSAGGEVGIFWMGLGDFVEGFGCVNVTPLITLVKDGGVWHKAEVRGDLSHAGSGEGEGGHHWFDELLAFSQYLLHAPSHPEAVFHVRLEVDHRPKRRDDAGGIPPIILSPFEYAHGDGTTPAVKSDISFKPPNKPVLQGIKGEQLEHGVAFMDLHSGIGSSLVVIPHIPRGGAPAAAAVVAHLKYTFTVHCDNPFTMRVVRPGATASTDKGVVWVSKSKE